MTMDIKGIDYNTQREKLVMPEYGREIQLMVQHACSLPSKEERLRCAKSIVRLMESRNPQARVNNSDAQAYWDHLYLISDKKLDIDWPYDVSLAEKFLAKPAPISYNKSRFKMRHYGRLLDESFERLKSMPPGEERDELARLTANQMKRDLANWGHGSTDDEKVADDIARLTDGVIQLDLNEFKFEKIIPGTDPFPMKRNKGKGRR